MIASHDVESVQSVNCWDSYFYSQYLNLVKSMPSASHVGRTKLDKERLKLCQYEVESVCQSAQELKGSTRDDGHIKDNLKAANALLQRLLNIAIEVSASFSLSRHLWIWHEIWIILIDLINRPVASTKKVSVQQE